MTEPNFKSDDEKLSKLLRKSRSAPVPPPRFQENVWRRIAGAEQHNSSVVDSAWLEVISSWVLRPRWAFAIAAALMLAGVGFGWSNGEQRARQDAQARYVATVAPNSLR